MAQNLQINWTAVHLSWKTSGMTRRQFWETQLEPFCPKGIPCIYYFYKRMAREESFWQSAEIGDEAWRASKSPDSKQQCAAMASLCQIRQLGENFQMIELEATDLYQDPFLSKTSTCKSKPQSPLRMNFPNGIEISFSSAEPERFALQLAALLGGLR